MSCVSYDPLVPARFILGTEQEPIPSHPSQKKSIFQIKLIRFESKLRMHPVLLRILWLAVRPQFLGFEPPLTPHEQAETVLCVVLYRQDSQIQKHSRTPANRTLRQADTGQSAVWLWVLIYIFKSRSQMDRFETFYVWTCLLWINSFQVQKVCSQGVLSGAHGDSILWKIMVVVNLILQFFQKGQCHLNWVRFWTFVDGIDAAWFYFFPASQS